MTTIRNISLDYELSVGASSDKFDWNRWNGLRVRSPGKEEIYLVDCGQRRLIPNFSTYCNLFIDFRGIIIADGISSIPLNETSLADGAIFVSINGTQDKSVYLLDRAGEIVKRKVDPINIMSEYCFAEKNIKVFDSILIDSIRIGKNFALALIQ